MFSPFPIQHRWSGQGQGPSPPSLHKRLTKRLLQFCRRKRNESSFKRAAKTKQTWHTPSSNGNDDGESIGQDMTYKAPSLVIRSGYPVGSVAARATLHVQQNVSNTYIGYLGDWDPALRIGSFPLSDLVPKKLDISAEIQCTSATGGPSRQKRPPGSPSKSNSNRKKPRKGNRQSNDKARNDADGDGDEAQSDMGSNDDEDDEDD
ncbi:hypothetical protein ACHAPQ_011564 [Fusarium lateritium]